MDFLIFSFVNMNFNSQMSIYPQILLKLFFFFRWTSLKPSYLKPRKNIFQAHRRAKNAHRANGSHVLLRNTSWAVTARRWPVSSSIQSLVWWWARARMQRLRFGISRRGITSAHWKATLTPSRYISFVNILARLLSSA